MNREIQHQFLLGSIVIRSTGFKTDTFEFFKIMEIDLLYEKVALQQLPQYPFLILKDKQPRSKKNKL